MSDTINIRGHNARVTITILGYERPDAADESDANWLSAQITCDAGDFRGSVATSLTTHEITALRDDLRRAVDTLTGTITFSPNEEALVLDLTFHVTGKASISCALQRRGEVSATLRFAFDSDQTFLMETLRELDAACSRVPIIGAMR